MKNLLYFLIPTFLLLSACTKDDDNQSNPETPKNYVSLKSPKIGQQNMYVQYKKECAQDDSFQYTGDTLLLTVAEVGPTTILIESFTEGSTNLSEMEDATYPLYSYENYILIPEREASWLFFFYGNDTIHLNREADVELTQDNCVLAYLNGEPFIGNEIGSITSFEIGDIAITNKSAISCVPVIMDIEAYLIYDEKGIEVSSTMDLLGSNLSGWVWVN